MRGERGGHDAEAACAAAAQGAAEARRSYGGEGKHGSGKCYDNPKEKTCACKIGGEIGHTQEEHKDGCTHCEENHPAEECPSSQVTCFLREGTTHYPAQCHIYPKVQQVVKQQKKAMEETLKKKILEEPVMNENIEDPDGQGLTRFFSNACYSCGEEGYFSTDCMKESHEYLGNFSTEKVEFDPLEIEELTRIKNSGKKRKYTRKGQISAGKDDLMLGSCFPDVERRRLMLIPAISLTIGSLQYSLEKGATKAEFTNRPPGLRKLKCEALKPIV
ncbi:hypothetical protein D1007_02938 [Hordeum vulgare]|nr:hypothetical protein D1007_02938 [Hordeum vulgare]